MLAFKLCIIIKIGEIMDLLALNTSDFVLRSELNENFTNVILPVTVFIGIEMFFGFFGNVLILLVYSRQYKRTNFRYCVLSMATVDLISCTTTLPGEIFSQLNWYDYKYAWICKTKSFFNIFTAWGSASILLVLAFDRYRKISHPLRWQIRTDLALRLCVCSLFLSLIVSIPVTILWGKHEYEYNYKGNNVTVSVCEKSSRYADSLYPLLYIGSVYCLPVGAMICVAGSLNFMTARKLFGHKVQISDTSLSPASSSSAVPSKTVTSEVLESDLHDQNDDSTADHCSVNNQTDVYSAPNRANGPGASPDNAQARHLETSGRQILNTTFYRKRKTIIMLVLTSVFIITMTVYVVLTTLVAKPNGILNMMSDTTKVVFFFFWRLYFINCMVNPILYGFLDPRFRTGLLSYFRNTVPFNHTFNQSHSSH